MCRLVRSSSSRLDMVQVFENTLLYIAQILVLDLLVNSVCGYALAKFEFRGKGLMLNFIVVLMVMTMEAIMLPLYIKMSQLGWVNTQQALVIPFVAKCFSIYMFRQFFCDVPDDLIEAASLDGCGPVKTFFMIVMPISKTVYATVFILDFVAHWNTADPLQHNYGSTGHISGPDAGHIEGIASSGIKG